MSGRRGTLASPVVCPGEARVPRLPPHNEGDSVRYGSRTSIRTPAMSISAADVKALRDKTNAPMMECKAALTEAGGDMEKAVDILRTKNKNIAVKRGEKETAEGR